MSVGSSADGLLSAEQTISLVRLVDSHDVGITEEQLLRDLRASAASSWSRGRNTIHKLISYGILTQHDGRLLPAQRGLKEANLRTTIESNVSNDLLGRIVSAPAWACLQFEPDGGNITIDMMAMPGMQDGLGQWLIDFGVLQRERVESRHWLVPAQRRETFITAAKTSAESPRRSKSAEKLAEELAAQAAVGAAAEDWVVEFERRRLVGHPLIQSIRRISPADVAAGYDIVSFASLTSLDHDLFIEVKAHGAAKRFYWSRNEIATALEFGEEYALYLVDMRSIADAGYSPHIIPGPTPELFSAKDSGWDVEPVSFEHVQVATVFNPSAEAQGSP